MERQTTTARPRVEILLVEDNPDDITLALYALNQYIASDRVHVVRDGSEALDFIFGAGEYANRSIDDGPTVVMLDLKLPKLDGVEVLRKIRANSRTKYLPVIMLTSSREERDIAECYSLGVNSYIVKPVDFDKFVDAIQTFGTYWLTINQPPRLPPNGSATP